MRKLYESRHVKEYLGIGKDQLYHWTQTRRLIEPTIEGMGRGGRSKFSFKNLIFIALIKELVDFGFELRVIKDFFERVEYYDPTQEDPIPHAKTKKKYKSLNIFEFLSKLKETNKDKKNIFYYFAVIKDKDVLFGFAYPQKGQPSTSKSFKSILQINLSIIIKELEEKTGEKF